MFRFQTSRFYGIVIKLARNTTMKIPSQILLSDLSAATQAIMDTVNQKIVPLTEKQLQQKTQPETWNALECLEHLNRFGAFYLPALHKTLENSKPGSGVHLFKSGRFGNWVATAMLPKNGVIKKMKTTRAKNPLYGKLPASVIDRFLNQQQQLLDLIRKSEKHNLNRVYVPTDITPFIKMKLGDTLRFLVYHNERHVVQAQKVLELNNQ